MTSYGTFFTYYSASKRAILSMLLPSMGFSITPCLTSYCGGRQCKSDMIVDLLCTYGKLISIALSNFYTAVVLIKTCALILVDSSSKCQDSTSRVEVARKCNTCPRMYEDIAPNKPNLKSIRDIKGENKGPYTVHPTISG